MQQIILTEKEYEILKNRIEAIYRVATEPEMSLENTTYSDIELCEFLGISKKMSQQYRKEGSLKYFKKGKKIFYKQKEIQNFLDKYRKEAENVQSDYD